MYILRNPIGLSDGDGDGDSDGDADANGVGVVAWAPRNSLGFSFEENLLSCFSKQIIRSSSSYLQKRKARARAFKDIEIDLKH